MCFLQRRASSTRWGSMAQILAPPYFPSLSLKAGGARPLSALCCHITPAIVISAPAGGRGGEALAGHRDVPGLFRRHAACPPPWPGRVCGPAPLPAGPSPHIPAHPARPGGRRGRSRAGAGRRSRGGVTWRGSRAQPLPPPLRER